MFLQNISKFISNYRYEQATVESLTTVKAAFLDFFGVTYRGMSEEAPSIALNTIEEILPKRNSNLTASIICRPSVLRQGASPWPAYLLPKLRLFCSRWENCLYGG